MPTLITEAVALMASGLLVATVLDGASDDDRLIAYCQYGSAVGSAVYIFRNKLYEHDGVLAAFLGNAGIGYLASPLACTLLAKWSGLPINLSFCLFVSGSVALFATWATVKLAPIVGSKLESSASGANVRQMLGRVLGMEIPKEQTRRKRTHHDGRTAGRSGPDSEG